MKDKEIIDLYWQRSDAAIADGFDLSAVIEVREFKLALSRFVRSLSHVEATPVGG